MLAAPADRSAHNQLHDLHQGMVVELDRRLSRDGSVRDKSRAGAEMSEGLENTLKLIERASSAVSTMHETLKSHEETIYDQRQRIMQLQQEKDEADKQLATVEKIVRSESERAARTEKYLQSLEARNAQIEGDYDLLKTNVDRLLLLLAPGRSK